MIWPSYKVHMVDALAELLMKDVVSCDKLRGGANNL